MNENKKFDEELKEFFTDAEFNKIITTKLRLNMENEYNLKFRALKNVLIESLTDSIDKIKEAENITELEKNYKFSLEYNLKQNLKLFAL